MMERNPYSINFGQIPEEMVERLQLSDSVLHSFLEDNPRQQVFMITGIRGSGKTVFMTSTAREISRHTDWIHMDLNARGDLLTDLCVSLSASHTLSPLFEQAQLGGSFAGMGISVGGKRADTHPTVELEKMLTALYRHHKKLLITVDEVTASLQIRLFTSEFQRWLRKDFPVYLLMTGLYKNIRELQNEEGMTFLYRAPKIMMGPLNSGAMAANYQKNLELSDTQAMKMARLTRGYSFAFQVLGSLTWNAGGNYQDVIPSYRQYLEEYSYEKIWSELSGRDQDVLMAMAELTRKQKTDVLRVADIRSQLKDLSPNLFNQYRKRLLRQGIVYSPRYGYLELILPLFADFVAENHLPL